MANPNSTATPATQPEHPAFTNLRRQIDDFETDLNFSIAPGLQPPDENVYRNATRYAHKVYIDALERATVIYDETERLRFQTLVNEGIAGIVEIARVPRVGQDSELMLGRCHQLHQKRQSQQELTKTVKARRFIEEATKKAQSLLDASALAEKESRVDVDDNEQQTQPSSSPEQQLLEYPVQSATSMQEAPLNPHISSLPNEVTAATRQEVQKAQKNVPTAQYPAEERPLSTTNLIRSSPDQQGAQAAGGETAISDAEPTQPSPLVMERISRRKTHSASPENAVSAPLNGHTPAEQALSLEDVVSLEYGGKESPPRQSDDAGAHANRKTTSSACTQQDDSIGLRRSSRKRATSSAIGTSGETVPELRSKKARFARPLSAQDSFVAPKATLYFTAINQESHSVEPTSDMEGTIAVAHPRTTTQHVAATSSRGDHQQATFKGSAPGNPDPRLEDATLKGKDKYGSSDTISSGIKDLAGVINGIQRSQMASAGTPYPGRFSLRQHKALVGEVSKKSGTLILKGKLIEWYGDEGLFTKDMWEYLTTTNHQFHSRRRMPTTANAGEAEADGEGGGEGGKNDGRD
ncbi:hypothetical protein EJ03DRAFT_337801 [Teratosphaeria nubilosa]|uniref:Uncharacterized protein n=1 Tax=Teratosphaeria nubilosa TaxID=161662 RepID=A0A6G1L2Z8_9PEZI|nr:hypothetical protein EJ03DRAFT_337801 [Teratosphaeria nubilosa]